MIKKRLGGVVLLALTILLSSACGKNVSVSDTSEIDTTEAEIIEEESEEKAETESEDDIAGVTTEDTSKGTSEKNSEDIIDTATENDAHLSDSIVVDVAEQEASSSFEALNTYISLRFYGTDAENSLKVAADTIGNMDELLNSEVIEKSIDYYNIEDKEYSGDIKELILVADEYSLATDKNFSLQIQESSEDNSLNIINIYKGYTADKVVDTLSNKSQEELSGALITMGGNVTLIGKKNDGSPWKIGIQDPFGETGEYLAVAKIDENIMDNNASVTVASKGTYGDETLENTASNVIDPKTGNVADSGIVGATIISADPTIADALGAAVIVMGYDKAVDFWRQGKYDFEMILIDKDSHIYITEGLKDSISTNADMTIVTQ